MEINESNIPEKGAGDSSTPAVSDRASNYTKELLDDVALLARYAIDAGLQADPKMLERLLLLQDKAEHHTLDEKDIALLVGYYDQLTAVCGEVTAVTVRATERVNERYWGSPTGAHLIKLWSLTLFVGLLIFFYQMLEYRVSYFSLDAGESITDANLFWVRLQHYASFFVPFTYGALGACAYLLRMVETKMQTREFDPGRIPQHWNRLVLGTLSGGMIVIFVNELPGSNGTTIQISEGALGFLAGYSIEFLFQALDRIIGAIIPKLSTASVATQRQRREKQLLISRYKAQLQKTDDPGQQKLLRGVINDLQE
ncbi:MAG: hypothetical protein GXP10_06075 [Gammaproteobacteria bacterium]|nr:hypothetical protein [Gammaproteobacteria bacterium]